MAHNNLGGEAAPNAVLNGGGQLTGSTLSGTSFGLFDVSGPGNASVISFLDSNLIRDSVGNPTDMVLSSSFSNFVLNSKDISSGLSQRLRRRNELQLGAWCFQGTANLLGSTVPGVIPEPSILALVGIGLLRFCRIRGCRKSGRQRLIREAKL